MKIKYPKEHSTVDKVRCGRNPFSEEIPFRVESHASEGEEINSRELRAQNI